MGKIFTNIRETMIVLPPEDVQLWQRLIQQIIHVFEQRLLLKIQTTKKLHHSPLSWNDPRLQEWWDMTSLQQSLMSIISSYIHTHNMMPYLQLEIDPRFDPHLETTVDVRSFFLRGSYSPEEQRIYIFIPQKLDLKKWDPEKSSFEDSRERLTARLRALIFHELTHHHQFTRRSLGIFQRTEHLPRPEDRPAFGPQARQFSQVQNAMIRHRKDQSPQAYHPALSLARKGKPFDVSLYLRDRLRARKDVERQRGMRLPPRVSNFTYYLAQPEELMAWAQGIGRLFLEWHDVHSRNLLIHDLSTVREHLADQPKAWHLFLRHLSTFLLQHGWTSAQIHRAFATVDLIY